MAAPQLTVVGRAAPAGTRDQPEAGGTTLTIRGAKYADGVLDLTKVKLSAAQVGLVAAVLFSIGGMWAVTLYRITEVEKRLELVQTTVRQLELQAASNGAARRDTP